MSTQKFLFDSSNWDSMIALMDKADKYPDALSGQNSDGELTTMSINKDCISVSTYQHNDWIRKNVYWRDKTTEELFER